MWLQLQKPVRVSGSAIDCDTVPEESEVTARSPQRITVSHYMASNIILKGEHIMNLLSGYIFVRHPFGGAEDGGHRLNSMLKRVTLPLAGVSFRSRGTAFPMAASAIAAVPTDRPQGAWKSSAFRSTANPYLEKVCRQLPSLRHFFQE